MARITTILIITFATLSFSSCIYINQAGKAVKQISKISNELKESRKVTTDLEKIEEERTNFQEVQDYVTTASDIAEYLPCPSCNGRGYLVMKSHQHVICSYCKGEGDILNYITNKFNE